MKKKKHREYQNTRRIERNLTRHIKLAKQIGNDNVRSKDAFIMFYI